MRDPLRVLAVIGTRAEAFALPGGQVFATAALVRRLKNEAQLAGVLGHEIGHVLGGIPPNTSPVHAIQTRL